MKPEALLRRCQSGALSNVRFADAVRLAEALGFTLKRVEGDHHIFERTGVHVCVNLQSVKGEAKPYQLRQVLKLVDEYSLTITGESDG